MSRFDQADETFANAHQTLAIQKGDIHRVCTVASAILHNHLAGDSWRPEAYKGSITLRSDDHPGRFVKVFVDYGNQLAAKCGLSIHDNPIVVGVELTIESAFVREVLRNEFSSIFSFYVDPRIAGNSKWWLKPHEERKYDILFLKQGPCEFELDEGKLVSLMDELDNAIKKGLVEPDESIDRIASTLNYDG